MSAEPLQAESSKSKRGSALITVRHLGDLDGNLDLSSDEKSPGVVRRRPHELRGDTMVDRHPRIATPISQSLAGALGRICPSFSEARLRLLHAPRHWWTHGLDDRSDLCGSIGTPNHEFVGGLEAT